jgi:predicted ester cyclase
MRDNDSKNDAVEHPQPSGELSRRALGVLMLAAGAASVVTSPSLAAGKPIESRNVTTYRRFIERGFNQGDLTVVDEIAAAHVEEHEYLARTDLSGPETLKTGIRETRKAIQMLQMTVEDIAESGDKVWSRLLVKGIEPNSGKPIIMTVMDISRFHNGKIVEHWGVPDRFAFLHQLGMLPPGAA